MARDDTPPYADPAVPYLASVDLARLGDLGGWQRPRKRQKGRLQFSLVLQFSTPVSTPICSKTGVDGDRLTWTCMDCTYQNRPYLRDVLDSSGSRWTLLNPTFKPMWTAVDDSAPEEWNPVVQSRSPRGIIPLAVVTRAGFQNWIGRASRAHGGPVIDIRSCHQPGARVLSSNGSRLLCRVAERRMSGTEELSDTTRPRGLLLRSQRWSSTLIPLCLLRLRNRRHRR
jgi:hypothetical protein